MPLTLPLVCSVPFFQSFGWLVVACVFGGLSLASFAGQWHWAMDLLSHFRLYFCWSALVLAGVATVRRRWSFTGLFLCLALVHIWDASFLYRQAVPTAAVDGEPPLRLMSLNAWLPNSDGARLKARVLAEKPDVLFIAEMSDPLLAGMVALRERYPYQFPAPGQNWNGLGLFSRYPWQDAGRFKTSDAQGGKLVLKATIDTPQGPLTVVGVHTTSPMSDGRWQYRNHEFMQLAHYVRGLPGRVVVLGDYNATPWSPAYRRYLTTTGFRIIEPPSTPVLTWPEWVPSVLRIPIDHMTASAGVAVVRKWSAASIGSDHRPVVAEIRLLQDTVRHP